MAEERVARRILVAEMGNLASKVAACLSIIIINIKFG